MNIAIKITVNGELGIGQLLMTVFSTLGLFILITLVTRKFGVNIKNRDQGFYTFHALYLLLHYADFYQ